MKNETTKLIKIKPYLDAFSFFSNDELLKNQFLQLYNEEPNSFSNFIEYIKYNNILIHIVDSEEKKQEKKIFRQNPNKAFDFLLDLLHKTFGGNEQNNKMGSSEIKREDAFNNFNDFVSSDKTFISDNYYGIKSIKKTCPDCKKSFYVYKYLKTIPIRIENNKDNEKLDLEKCIKKLQSKFMKEEFCIFCSSTKNKEIKIKIEKYPKIIIFVLIGNEQFLIKKNFKHGEYELIALEYMTKQSLCDLIFFPCINNKNYNFIYKSEINDEILENKQPIVLFYKKRQQMLILGKDSKDSIISDETTNNNDSINNIINNKIIDMKDIQLKIPESEEKEKEKKINDITLRFKFSKNNKVIEFKTNDCETFENIIKELKKENNLDDIDNEKIFFNNEKILMNKTPKDYNITTDNNYIMIN